MSIDDENRQWAWDELLETKRQLKNMKVVADSHRQAAILMKERIYEADNPKDYFEKEIRAATLYREVKRARRLSGLR